MLDRAAARVDLGGGRNHPLLTEIRSTPSRVWRSGVRCDTTRVLLAPSSRTETKRVTKPANRSAFEIHWVGQDLGLSATFHTMTPPGFRTLSGRRNHRREISKAVAQISTSVTLAPRRLSWVAWAPPAAPSRRSPGPKNLAQDYLVNRARLHPCRSDRRSRNDVVDITIDENMIIPHKPLRRRAVGLRLRSPLGVACIARKSASGGNRGDRLLHRRHQCRRGGDVTIAQRPISGMILEMLIRA